MTTDGGGWTIIARSTRPNTWEVSNQYALGHFDYWINEENYTYNYRVFLDSLINGDQAEVRFYDHINIDYMDIRYSFNKNHLLAINLDSEQAVTNVSRTDIKTTFDKSVKAVTGTSFMQQRRRLLRFVFYISKRWNSRHKKTHHNSELFAVQVHLPC